MHWISTVKHKNFKPSHIRVLCPEHFSTDETDCHCAVKVRLKENAEPNTFSSNILNLQKNTELLQKWKEINPVEHQEMTIKGGISKFHCDTKENKKIYVKMMWDESVSKIPKTMHALQAGTVSSNLPKCLPQKNKRQFLNRAVAKKRIKKGLVQFSRGTKSECLAYLSDNSGVKEIDLVSSPSDTETEQRDLSDSSIETELEGGMEPINFASDVKEDGIDSNNSHSDTESERRLGVEGINYRNARSVTVPNEWWGITCTPQYIIFSKWNEFYDSVFKVIIENNYNMKIFIKGRECVNENRKVHLENISAVLQEVDSYKICAGIDDKTMTNCMGHLENVPQEQFSIWCKGCQKKKKELMKI